MKKKKGGGAYKNRRRNKVCVCAFCKQVFYATRSDAKTCTERCRKALSRLETSEWKRDNEDRVIPIKSKGAYVDSLLVQVGQDVGRIWQRVT